MSVWCVTRVSLPAWRVGSTVYPDGKVCISILHAPGEDRFNEQESADERWRPILGVESIIISVISMLSDPNDESPANIDAAVSGSTCDRIHLWNSLSVIS